MKKIRKPSRGWTQTPNFLLELWSGSFLSATEKALVAFTFRETKGFKRHSTRASRRIIAEKTGYSNPSIGRAFSKLEGLGIIKIYSPNEGTISTEFGLDLDQLFKLMEEASDKKMITLENPARGKKMITLEEKNDNTSVKKMITLDEKNDNTSVFKNGRNPSNDAVCDDDQKTLKKTLKRNSLKESIKTKSEEVSKPSHKCDSDPRSELDPKPPIPMISHVDRFLRRVEFDYQELVGNLEAMPESAKTLAVEEMSKHVMAPSGTRKNPLTWKDRHGAVVMAVQEFRSKNLVDIKSPWAYVLKMAKSHLDYAAHVNHTNFVERKRTASTCRTEPLEYNWRDSKRAQEMALNRLAKERGAQ